MIDIGRIVRNCLRCRCRCRCRWRVAQQLPKPSMGGIVVRPRMPGEHKIVRRGLERQRHDPDRQSSYRGQGDGFWDDGDQIGARDHFENGEDRRDIGHDMADEIVPGQDVLNMSLGQGQLLGAAKSRHHMALAHIGVERHAAINPRVVCRHYAYPGAIGQPRDEKILRQLRQDSDGEIDLAIVKIGAHREH